MVWPAIIAAAGGLASVGLQDYLAGNSATEQYYNNKKLMQYQNEWNLPVNQVRRLEEAGLNPKFFLGEGANVPSGSASVSPRQVPNVPNSASDALGAMARYQGYKNMTIQNDLLQNQAYTQLAVAQNVRTKTDLVKAQLKDMQNSTEFYERTGQFREADWRRGLIQQFMNMFPFLQRLSD